MQKTFNFRNFTVERYPGRFNERNFSQPSLSFSLITKNKKSSQKWISEANTEYQSLKNILKTFIAISSIADLEIALIGLNPAYIDRILHFERLIESKGHKTIQRIDIFRLQIGNSFYYLFFNTIHTDGLPDSEVKQ